MKNEHIDYKIMINNFKMDINIRLQQIENRSNDFRAKTKKMIITSCDKYMSNDITHKVPLTLDDLREMTHMNMENRIISKHGIMFHRLCDTCIVCEKKCGNLYFSPNYELNYVSCCDNKECKKIAGALIYGASRMIPCQNITENVSVRRSSGDIENDWKVDFFDVASQLIIVQKNSAKKGVEMENFHSLNPFAKMDLTHSPKEFIEVYKLLFEQNLIPDICIFPE
jgi:hypothetical protein